MVHPEPVLCCPHNSNPKHRTSPDSKKYRKHKCVHESQCYFQIDDSTVIRRLRQGTELHWEARQCRQPELPSHRPQAHTQQLPLQT